MGPRKEAWGLFLTIFVNEWALPVGHNQNPVSEGWQGRIPITTRCSRLFDPFFRDLGGLRHYQDFIVPVTLLGGSLSPLAF